MSSANPPCPLLSKEDDAAGGFYPSLFTLHSSLTAVNDGGRIHFLHVVHPFQRLQPLFSSHPPPPLPPLPPAPPADNGGGRIHFLHVVNRFQRVEQLLHAHRVVAPHFVLDGCFHRDFGKLGLQARFFERHLDRR